MHCQQLLIPFNGYYTGQPVSASTSVNDWMILLQQSFTTRMPLLRCFTVQKLSNGMRAVKLCCNKIIQSLTEVLADTGCPV